MAPPSRLRLKVIGALLLGALSAALGAGCHDAPADERPCSGLLSEAVVFSEGALVYPDESLEGIEGWVVDPEPLKRGHHPVERFWRDEATCEWLGGWYNWAPPWREEVEVSPQAWEDRLNPGSRLRSLVLVSGGPGSQEDLTTWTEALAPSVQSMRVLHAPTRSESLDALEESCRGADKEDSLWLVATGPGSLAGGASLVLASEALSYAALMAHLAEVCADLGLIIVTLDASYIPELADAWPPSAPPLALWRASDPYVPDAPRTHPHGGGLLSKALSRTWRAAMSDNCADKGAVTPWGLWQLMPAPEAVRHQMKEERWLAFNSGLLGPLDALHPTQGLRMAADAEAQLPLTLLTRFGEPTEALTCASDEDCAPVASECTLAPCRTLSCLDGRCQSSVAVDAPCDDGSVCTADDRCTPEGFCRGTAIDCDDGSPCTLDSCLHNTGCVHGPLPGAPCDDLDLCTTDDRCQSEGICLGHPIDCADENPCTDEWCDPIAGCLMEANHAPCDDGSACTTPDYCEEGVCRGAPLVCVDDDPCTADTCDLNSGCLNPPLPEGSPCDDSDACTRDERCIEGGCVGGTSECDDGFACTLDSCDVGTCIHLPEPGTCITDAGCIPVGAHPLSNPCLTCVSTNTLAPNPEAEGAPCPDDGIPCTSDLCEEGACLHVNTPGTCHGPDGTCVELGEAITPCLTCTGTGVGSPAVAGTPCEESSSCVVDALCDGLGECTSTPVPCCPIASGLACGVVFEGSTALAPAASAVDTWSCLPVPYPAAERAHIFSAPCDGQVIFNLQGQPGQLLFLIRGPPAHAEDPATQCLSGECDTYTSAGLTQWMFHDQEFILVVDGAEGSEGDYTIEVLCECPQPAP